MAYMDQERKKELEPAIKAILKKYGVKASISVKHYSTLVLTVASSKIDFLGEYNVKTTLDYIQVNHFWIKEWFEGKAKDFLIEIEQAMNVSNFDHSDSQSDYFHVGWYIDINIGKGNKPYVLM